ncbi:GNAT family N-acetyltransferase [Pullulanibacillus sp. KACC 23026]|uniref:GNAT family N-acetyltransferase n=1 Tax=Pullulanibacillus sp. KACC 23026 TaxID=3028315 RepID=UPI0023AEFC2F|nr:GNAT family N-acetyltransferase [Pullulanibacillus sp. KACC 23026]WEG10899.1 GNAT family N-acetyltransferase [Pullulanibacillus sp. KACC 23026]
MSISFKKLIEPDSDLASVISQWENDPSIIPLTRPNQNQEELDHREEVTVEELMKRMEHHQIYLIYLDDQLVGEMNYMVDPSHLYKKETGTAWIGITIGEPVGRGKGVGYKAIQFLENEIKKQGLNRIELGVFEFNQTAHKLYSKMGYKEIGRIDQFTYWQGKMWTDIRMEKYFGSANNN